jgi:hypothetical protein
VKKWLYTLLTGKAFVFNEGEEILTSSIPGKDAGQGALIAAHSLLH